MCTKCGKRLPRGRFNRDRTKRDGLYSSCKKCRRRVTSRYAPAQAARTRQRHDSRRAAGACVRCGLPAAAGKTYCEAHLEEHRKTTRMRRYGLSAADFDARLAQQGGRCAICGATQSGGNGWHVDHCHATGALRGILCMRCNTSIGKLGDTSEGVMRAVRYLRAAEAMIDAAPERTRR